MKRNHETDDLIDDGPWWAQLLLALLAAATLVVWLALLGGKW